MCDNKKKHIMKAQETKPKETKEKSFKNWIRNNIFEGNIFQEKIYDGCLYFVLYIVLPIIITSVSLIALGNADVMNVTYCYITILISALGCIYDAINRWEHKYGSERNRKIFIMLLCLASVVIYCLVVIFIALIPRVIIRMDVFLLAYVVSSVIAFVDVVNCFLIKLTKQKIIAQSGGEEG